MKPIVKVWRDERGNACAGSNVARNELATTAMHVVSSIIASDAIKGMIEDETRTVNATRISVVACDIAEALYAEMDMRGWLTEFDPSPKRFSE